MYLKGKTALVTGSALGFGAGIAQAMGRAGAKVCATDVDDENLDRCAASMKSDGCDVMALHLDAADSDAFRDTVDKMVSRWNRVDILVHTGVIMPLLHFEETSEDLGWRELKISLGGLLNGTRAVWEVMKARGGGHIISIASGSSFRGYTREVMYCTGKHAAEGFVKALALEAAPYNISLNTVGPGKTIKPTGLTGAQLEKTPEAIRARWTDPVELGNGLVWLASQPAGRFSGLRFDAGPIVDTISSEGWDFVFSPEKVSQCPDDMKSRLEWQAHYCEEMETKR